MTSTASRIAVCGRHANDRSNLYRDITRTIIAELEAGRLPWVQPWGSPGVPAALGMPRNAATGRRYSGINVLMLWAAVAEHGFPVQSWLTFKQALALGGHVRKGERGTTVVYADRFVPGEARELAHARVRSPAPSRSSSGSRSSTSSSAKACRARLRRRCLQSMQLSSCRKPQR